MSEAYYNTTSLKGSDLKQATEKALTQKQIIHELFLFDQTEMTPFEVAVKLLKQGYKFPVWSLRARMTDLTREGVLVKSDDADKTGEFGAKNHSWKLKAGKE